MRLLKSAVVYGANASGKSNFLKAFMTFRSLIIQSNGFKIDKEIYGFEPFLLDRVSRNQSSKFEMTFLLKGAEYIKYRYAFEYNRTEIVAETLDYYPNGQVNNLYERKYLKGDYHEIKKGDHLKKTGIHKKFLKNQLILSKFGSEPHEQLNTIYRFLDDISIGNVLDQSPISNLVAELGIEISKPENEPLAHRLALLIKAADTQMEGLFAGEMSDKQAHFIQNLPFPETVKAKIIEDNRIRIRGRHPVYENGQIVAHEDFDFQENVSHGTNALFLVHDKKGVGGMDVRISRIFTGFSRIFFPNLLPNP